MVNIKQGVPYYLLNLYAGTYLTVDDRDGVSIVGNQYTNGTGQHWVFYDAGAGQYSIEPAYIPGYVGVPNNAVNQGQQLQVVSSPFAWNALDVDNIGPAARFSTGVNSNLYADLSHSNPADYTEVLLWPLTGNNNQVWVLDEVKA